MLTLFNKLKPFSKPSFPIELLDHVIFFPYHLWLFPVAAVIIFYKLIFNSLNELNVFVLLNVLWFRSKLFPEGIVSFASLELLHEGELAAKVFQGFGVAVEDLELSGDFVVYAKKLRLRIGQDRGSLAEDVFGAVTKVYGYSVFAALASFGVLVRRWVFEGCVKACPELLAIVNRFIMLKLLENDRFIHCHVRKIVPLLPSVMFQALNIPGFKRGVDVGFKQAWNDVFHFD